MAVTQDTLCVAKTRNTSHSVLNKILRPIDVQFRRCMTILQQERRQSERMLSHDTSVVQLSYNPITYSRDPATAIL
jgi:hypothetical protein